MTTEIIRNENFYVFSNHLILGPICVLPFLWDIFFTMVIFVQKIEWLLNLLESLNSKLCAHELLL